MKFYFLFSALSVSSLKTYRTVQSHIQSISTIICLIRNSGAMTHPWVKNHRWRKHEWYPNEIDECYYETGSNLGSHNKKGNWQIMSFSLFSKKKFTISSWEINIFPAQIPIRIVWHSPLFWRYQVRAQWYPSCSISFFLSFPKVPCLMANLKRTQGHKMKQFLSKDIKYAQRGKGRVKTMRSRYVI